MKVTRTRLRDSEETLLMYWRQHLLDWPMDPGACLRFTEGAADNLWLYAAYSSDECCGLLANEEGKANALWLLHVSALHRRMGVGSELLKAARAHVSGSWSAGRGTGYWWQGVPLGCGDDFLEKRGFSWSWTSVDMLADLTDWTNPISNTTIPIGKLVMSDAPQLIKMLDSQHDLRNWVGYYSDMVSRGQHDRILVARTENRIVGCAMVLDEDDIRWSALFTGKSGGVGCLGVVKSHQSRGIGTALAVAVTDELRQLGYDHSYVGYTWLEDWYARLGYRTVCRQRMGELSQ